MWAVGAVLGLRLREMSLRACVLRIAIIYTSFSEVPLPPPQQTLSVLEAYITPALLLRFARNRCVLAANNSASLFSPCANPLCRTYTHPLRALVHFNISLAQLSFVVEPFPAHL
jgi:hypothetical protein